MRSIIIALLIFASLIAISRIDKARSFVNHLQDVSVMIDTIGSGTVVKKGDKTFVITAEHVIHKFIEEGYVDIVKIYKKDDVVTRTSKNKAKIIKFGKVRDIAILEVEEYNQLHVGAVFADNTRVPIGTNIHHVGCFLGYGGYNSYSKGVIAQYDRAPFGDGSSFMQIDTTHYKGSSGGGLFDDEGRYIGMVLRTHDANMGLAADLPSIRKWAKRADMLWVFDNQPGTPGKYDQTVNVE